VTGDLKYNLLFPRVGLVFSAVAALRTPALKESIFSRNSMFRRSEGASHAVER
jgi:hypothetical protein